jgi:hypothetical protein
MQPKSENIGEVVFLSEKMQVAREISSCCIGTEAYFEAGLVKANQVQRQAFFPIRSTIGEIFRKFIKV